MSRSSSQDFRDIAFGYASSEAEKSYEPDLLLSGYVDLQNASESIRNGLPFLVLGHKGSGKSAIAERLELIFEGDSNAFVKLVSLSDFPFTPFSKLVRGDVEPEAKLPDAWSWIMLIYIIESFEEDKGLTHPDPSSLIDAVNAFREMGLSPNSNPATIVRKSANRDFKIALPGKLAQYSWSKSETASARELPYFVHCLRNLVLQASSESRHFLVIDGLDDIVTSRDIQYRSLSALIFEVNRLNGLFASNCVPIKIIVLCRTDLFDRLPGGNKNKVRQDSTIELDWYRDPRNPRGSKLVQIAKLRTKRSLGESVDLFDEFFPDSIEGNGRQIETTLLDMTRHTPRDFLRLLHYIQQFCTKTGEIPIDEINSGMREYSIRYFMPEIRDELSGYFKAEEIASLVSALGRLRKRDFKFHELVGSVDAMGAPLSNDRLGEIVRALFKCSAIGNLQRRSNGTTYYTFKFRNLNSEYNDLEDIILHKGLWKALNLI
ncbi:MAG: hypothetical protein F4213_12640 [Boseongicola sp. SB0677_bin_26]|nr:hypothetical protein [Boseongicola sp. SB0665_bin_10]MYG26850.1 hypothetical protein [Boseongicola sp. SB0677_bin_26]